MTGFLILAVMALVSWDLRTPLPIVLYVMGVLLLGAWRNRHGRHLALYRRIRPMMVLQSIGLLACVGAAVFVLLSLGNPILDFSWLGLLQEHMGSAPGGLPAGGPLGSAPAAGNVLMEPLSYRWLALPFMALLFFLLPQLALAEEEIFRRGTRTWAQGAYRSLAFGLAHLPMGIPVGAALALSIGGLWFTYQYFRGGVQRAATYHLTYNLLALTLVVIVLLVTPI